MKFMDNIYYSFSINSLLAFQTYRNHSPINTRKEDRIMNVDQHLKVAQWHIEQARLHATTQHGCGCPVNEHYQNIIDEVESGAKIEEELTCSVDK